VVDFLSILVLKGRFTSTFLGGKQISAHPEGNFNPQFSHVKVGEVGPTNRTNVGKTMSICGDLGMVDGIVLTCFNDIKEDSSHAAEVSSWPVYGLFQNLSIALVGTEQRARAMSDLLFDFTPRHSAENSRGISGYMWRTYSSKTPFKVD
jgi:hypothetical protein